MGAMDPSESNQMAGRAGRGRGKHEGLVILFVQPNIPSGKNLVSEINVNDNMDNQERMHALRFTPCCLRVVYSLDTL
jgi:superfamily II helicase